MPLLARFLPGFLYPGTGRAHVGCALLPIQHAEQHVLNEKLVGAARRTHGHQGLRQRACELLQDESGPCQ